MPVMKRLVVGGTTYDTVGEASVTQVQSSGTKIATIAIDGTSTDLYAPAGGSSVDPATAAPNMDGTAAVGSSAKYAREDHVHPTDTSRQATLVSGTNIKTVNGNSLLGSGDITIQGGGSASTFYGSGTVTSHVLNVTATEWEASSGNILMVNLTNSASGLTSCATSIAVNGGSSVPIYLDGAACSYTSFAGNYVPFDDGEVATFVYDGTAFQFVAKSLAFAVVVNANSNSTGDDGYIRLSSLAGNYSDFNKKPLILSVKMVSAGTTENYSTWGSNGGLRIIKYDDTTTSHNGPVLWNGLHVGRQVVLSWKANEILLFCKEPLATNFFLIGKSGEVIPDSLPKASSSTLGGVKVGSGLSIDANGVLSLDVASASGVSF